MSSWTPSGGRIAWPTGFSGEIRILGLAGNSKMPMSGCSGAGAGRAERLALQGFAYGAGKGTRTPDPLLGNPFRPFEAPIHLRSLVFASAYLVGSGDDSWVPQTSGIVPLCPSVWLQFGYSAAATPPRPGQVRRAWKQPRLPRAPGTHPGLASCAF